MPTVHRRVRSTTPPLTVRLGFANRPEKPPLLAGHVYGRHDCYYMPLAGDSTSHQQSANLL